MEPIIKQTEVTLYQFSNPEFPADKFDTYMLVNGERQTFIQADSNQIFHIDPIQLQLPVGDYQYLIFARCLMGKGQTFVEKNLFQIVE